MLTRIEIRKLHGDVRERPLQRLEVRNQFRITSLEEDTASSPSFRIGFTFTSTYNDAAAQLEIEGEALMIVPAERAELVRQTWREKKILPEEEMVAEGNIILHKVQMLAIMLAHELGLQSPLKLPHLEPPSNTGTP